MSRFFVACLIVATANASLSAQSPAVKPATPKRVQPATKAANKADVSSIDAIIKATYDVISGDVGEARNWDRMRSLFHPTAKMMPITTGRDGKARPMVITVEDYIKRSGPMLVERGFKEREIARKVEHFHHLAHVWSTYEGFFASDTKKPIVSGVNSFQLLFDNERWWVLSIAWSPATKEHPLPQKTKPKQNK